MKKLLSILFSIYSFIGYSQEYASKDYYLIDSLDLKELSESDKIILDSSLHVYHNFPSDTSKIMALDPICQNLMHISWEKYQFFQYNLINDALERKTDPQTNNLLLKLKGDALSNIGLIYIEQGEGNKGYKAHMESYAIRKELVDSSGIANSLNHLGLFLHQKGKTDTAIFYLKRSYEIRKKLKDTKGVANSLNNLASIYEAEGEIEKSIEMFTQSEEYYNSIGKKDGQAVALNNIGSLFEKLGKIEQAIDAYHQSLKISEEIGNVDDISIAYNNLGKVYANQNDSANGIKYYQLGLDYAIKVNNKREIAGSLNNIGTFYKLYGNDKLAKTFMRKSLKVKQQAKEELKISVTLNNLAFILLQEDSIDLAKKYSFKGLKHDIKLNDHFSYAQTTRMLSQIYLTENNLDSCLYYGKKSMKIAKALGYPILIKNQSAIFHKAHKRLGNFEDALLSYEEYITMNDSINNEETQKATIRQQTKYEFEKAQLVAEQQRKEELRIQNEELIRRNNLQYSLIFLGILLFFGAVLSLGFIKVSPTLAEGLIFFAFLILFEFLLVLSDPFIDSITGGEPIYKLLANAVLAGLIFPLHAFFERTLKKKLVK